MNYPVRMNLVEIKIRRLNVAGTRKDADFAEARRSKTFLPETTVLGQVNFGTKTVEDTVRTHTGNSAPTGAWVVFKITDLETIGWEPKHGDRVTSIAGRPYNFEIRATRAESPLRGKFLLLYCVVEEVKEERASF